MGMHDFLVGLSIENLVSCIWPKYALSTDASANLDPTICFTIAVREHIDVRRPQVEVQGYSGTLEQTISVPSTNSMVLDPHYYH